jgi:predicted TPR repeat methyltransferase
MSLLTAPNLEDLELPVASRASGWTFPGARAEAEAYTQATGLPADEFLSWLLEVKKGLIARWPQPSPRRMPPPLPLPSGLGALITAWAEEDAQLSAWIRNGTSIRNALERWGAQLLQTNKTARGLEAFRAVTALSPENAPSWSNLGVAYDLAGYPNESVACLERSLSLAPKQPDTWLQLGFVRQKQGDSAKAEAAYRAALEHDVSHAVAWQCLGLLKEQQTDFPGAIDCFQACIDRGGRGAAIFANLGRLCYRIGRFAAAHRAYAQAADFEQANPQFAAMERKLRFIRQIFEGDSVDLAAQSFRKDSPLEGSARDDELRDIFDKAFGLLAGFGHIDAALRVGRKSLDLWSPQPTTAYLVRALEGGHDAPRSPEDYIVEHFDRFADQFDAQLVGELGYDIPQKLCALLTPQLGGRLLDEVLDAGCGTGLCGPYLRPLARRLTGVDLSSKMLGHAAKKGCYHRLVCQDLVRFLGQSQRSFDLIVAADVMIYFGDLAPLLTSCAYALRPGGLLVFSTESHDGDGYRLLPSGRFSQAPDYVQRTACPEFTLLSSMPTTIRLEATERVGGRLFIFRRL